MAGYTIRQFRPADTDDFLELNAEVLGEGAHGREWFSWKYEANPYVDHVPIVVAELEGDLVGARPFFGLSMAVAGRQYTALQPGDTMVHPDHRRKGLFTRMTERAIDRYEREEPAFFFNFPNDRSLKGYLKLGWHRVGTLPRSYRVNDPTRVLASRYDDRRLAVAGTVATRLVAGYDRLREAVAPAPRDVPIRREETVPADVLASIYRRGVPEEIHAVRDEQFYEWRFDNPDWEYTTYYTEDRTVGAVVGASASSGPDVTRIVDVVPLTRRGGTDQLVALLDRILAAHSESALFVAPTSVLPPSVLRGFGFLSEGTPPLSLLTDGRAHVVRSLGEWELRGIDVREPNNWQITFAETDTS